MQDDGFGDKLYFLSTTGKKNIAEGKILSWKNDINGVLKEEKNIVCHYKEDEAKVK